MPAENVWVEEVEPLREVMPELLPQVPHANPPAWVELAVRQVLSAPTVFVNHVVPDATIKLPVVVAKLFISFTRPGKLKAWLELRD